MNDAEAGTPSLATGGSPYKTSEDHDIVSRPPWATNETNTALDAALYYNPDVSHAKWVAGLLGFNGWRLEAYRQGSNGPTDEPFEEAQQEAQAFAERVMTAYGGGIDAMLEVALSSLLHRGAVAPELDVADSRDDVLDVDFCDPTKVDFQVVKQGPHRRVIPVYQQDPRSEPKPFNQGQFCYLGINKGLGMPHGASPFLPVIETIPRQKALRRSLGRVSTNSAFSRIKFTIDYDRVARSLPGNVVRIKTDGSYEVIDRPKFVAMMNAARSDVQTAAERMYEDDIWTVFDHVSTGSVGADHGKESLSPKDLAELFDTDAIVSAKSQPSLHGRGYGNQLSSTGQVQWMVAALGIERMRDYPARAVEFVLNSWARIRGIPAHFVLVFPEVRKEDRKAEAEASKIETETAIMRRDQGWIDDNEAAMDLTGHEAVGIAPAPEPEAQPAEPVAPVVEGEGDAGDVEAAHPLTLRALLGHTSDCACGTCGEPEGARLVAGELAEQFEPESTDVASIPELVSRHRFDTEDVEDAVRAFRRRARAITPAWADLLDAVEVTSEGEEGSLFRLDPAPPSEWKSTAWQWDSHIARYRYKPQRDRQLGRIVPQDRVRRVLDRHLDATAKEMGEAAQRLTRGQWSPRRFQLEMADLSANAHMQARLMATGGSDQATTAIRGAAQARWQTDMRYLGDFGQQIARGQGGTEAQVAARARMYARATIADTYEDGLLGATRAAGYQEERWVLGNAEHCPGCVDQAGRGWVVMGDLPGIGTQECRMGCHCTKEQRVSSEQRYPTRMREGAVA